MFDDDISVCSAFASVKKWRLNPDEVAFMVENTAYCAKGAGAKIFGWNQRADPRVLNRCEPFGLTAWVGGAVGVIGKSVVWDKLLRFKCDIDACLSELLTSRIVWQEKRFCFEQQRDKNLGGNSLFRSPEAIEAEKRYLKGKWRGNIETVGLKTQERVKIRVVRRQAVDL